MSRPLLVIFLTVFVNLVGFGIIIPLLPFYAETFGASPLSIGLLFAVFSLCQLVASPVLGDWSDRYGRRPVLILSLAGTVVSLQEPYAMNRLDDLSATGSLELQPFERGRHSLLAAPLTVGSGVHVVLELFDKQGGGGFAFTEADRKGDGGALHCRDRGKNVSPSA